MSMDTALFSDHTSTSSTTHSARQLLGVVPGKVEPVLLHLDLEHHRQPTRTCGVSVMWRVPPGALNPGTVTGSQIS